MKLIFAILVAFSSMSYAATDGLVCTVQGSHLVNGNELSKRYVSTAKPTTLTVILKEDEDSGTYMTYVKLNLSFRPHDNSPLVLTAVSTFSDVLSIQSRGPLEAEMQVRSRLGHSPMTLNVECRLKAFDYLLVPELDRAQDPLDGFQNAAFTIPKLWQDLASRVYFHPNTESESEFIASHFCTQGDSQKLFNDIKSHRSYPGMWRTSALGDHVLSPQNLRLDGNSVRWEQPQEMAVCIRSHVEDLVDDDGVPYSVEVCDEYRVDQLEPLALEIKNCDLQQPVLNKRN